ncbi:MAG: sulfotransferase [Gammaproteobacteria bacterium]|nr:sulfotransferase [Gammaproteobacteria bacterium]
MRDTLREGFGYLQAGQPEKASQCCRRVLGAKPDIPEGHFLVGLVALELNERRTAIEAFGSVTQLQPEHGAAWAHLARLYMQAGWPARADGALEKAMAHEDGNPLVHDLIGLVLSLLGDEVTALGWYERAAAADQQNVAFRINHANCQVFTGHLDEAEGNLREVLEIQPGNANAHWILSGLRKATDHSHIERIDSLIASGEYPRKARAFLYYAKGKELEDLEEWEDAFDAFDHGAKARRATLDYFEEQEDDMYVALQRTYTREWLSSAGDGASGEAPIFVVGQPRTGTTLVERIITSHSQVHSAGELKQFGNALRRISRYSEPVRFTARLVEDAARLDPRTIGEMYLDTTRTMAGSTPRFVDKLPLNFLYLPLILKALPNARIVHLKRNPMDACFSSFKQLFADAYPHSYDQEEMARHHARYYRLMETWHERFGDRYFEVAYEEVARNLEESARRLIDYLGLPWEDACLDFHQQSSAVSTASSVQVRQPVHTRSIGRWRRYERQLEPMRNVIESLNIPLEFQA